MTLVDSNVFLDLITQDEQWEPWSKRMLTDVAELGPVLINPVVYAEISVGFAEMGSLDRVVPEELYVRVPLPWSAAFLAGKCFQDYRKRGGTKHAPLPDFFIGAHAAVSKLRLLTRDARRYRTYFPTVELIAPENPEN
ncbi:type II toxin-antitoxin system VapC family toxin [Haloactinomyces albus]|uniref:Nucleic acid-binding protein n=1 Tax=Haloactinomyces albus TaxID=1352928 RepID=A0AAE3Z9U3_9ACTN|nr:type II toxin-antitoxin system VapC family toxin [Haloactinomyces albus]MDR7300978.1 putative nucleic acid-binding protein [Haloactinomyces albus]